MSEAANEAWKAYKELYPFADEQSFKHGFWEGVKDTVQKNTERPYVSKKEEKKA